MAMQRREEGVSEWLETYRGVVNPWECDVVQHFTIAYYFDRFADATRNYFDLLGTGDALAAGVGTGLLRGHATFQHELRAGEGFYILSAVTAIDAGVLQLGHRVVDSTTGKTITWLTEWRTLSESLPSATRGKLAALCAAWEGPKVPDRPVPRTAGGPLTARDRVKPWEIAEDGTMSLPAHIHRFSAAGMQILTAVGMTAGYMQEQRRGYSTFELDLIRVGEARVGDIIDVTTSVSHLGKSSLRFAHRMTGKNGREIAFLSQSGVHLDMDARRSTAIPDELRASIERLLSGNP
jgi:acyl-CoA thioesterase FadM